MLNKNDYNDKKIKIIMITCEIFCFLYYIQSLVLYLFPSLY